MSRLMIVEVPSYSCEFKGIREICELVRCGECIRWEDGRVDFSNCKLMGIVKPDDFCSYGEREGE